MIIGLHGKMGAGKNECARRLAFLSDQAVVEVSFAAKLKQSAAALLDCTVDDLERWKNDPRVLVELNSYHPSGEAPHKAITVRRFLQLYGTEAHRDVFGADFWLDAALPLDGITGLYDPEYAMALYVVTDVRFPNEAQRVRDLGGVVVQVVGPDAGTGSHVSEQPLECDHTIRNVVRDDSFISLDERLGYLLRIVGDPAYEQLAA